MDDWRAAERFLSYKPPKVMPRSISWSFELLDRMAREAQQERCTLTCKHVNQVIDRWRIGSRNHNVNPSDWPASKVLERVEGYAAKLPTLQLDTKTYAMIMAAQIKQNPAESPLFCTDIVQKMTHSQSARPNAVALTYLMDAHVQSQQSNAVQATQSLFDYLVEQGQEDPTMAPTEKSLTRVLQAWVTLIPPGIAIDEALDVMKRNIQILVRASEEAPKVLPNATFVDLVLEESSKRGNSAISILLADALLTHVIELAEQYPRLLPEAKTLSRMIFLWRNMGLPDAPERTEHWLDEMCRLWQHVPGYDSPRYTVYAAAIAAWGNSDRPEALWHVDRIFQRMVRDTGTATIGCYQTLIQLACQNDDPQHAEQILRDMVAASESDQGLLPPVSAFVEVIQAWQRSPNNPESASSAHDILKLLLDCKGLYPDRYQELHRVPFEACLQLWSHVDGSKSATKIRLVLEWMKQQEISPSYHAVATVAMCLSAPEVTNYLDELERNADTTVHDSSVRADAYERVLKRWSVSFNDTDAGKHAEELLERYLMLLGNCDSAELTSACFRNVIASWVVSGAPEAPQKVTELLERMCRLLDRVKGDSSSFATAAEAWALSGLPDSPEQTEHYLSQAAERSRSEGNLPEATWYEQVIVAFVKNKNLREAEAFLQRSYGDGVVPTTGMYAPIIKALAGTSNGYDLDHATRLLNELVESFMHGNSSAKPSADLFGILISARAKRRESDQIRELWTMLEELRQRHPAEHELQGDLSTTLTEKSGGLGREASILLQLLGDSLNKENEAVVDAGTIACVLEALAKSGDPSSGRRAEGIILKMQELHEKGALDLNPTFYAFQKVIDCWSNMDEEGSAARANDVLTLAERISQEGNKQTRPDRDGYMSVITAWSKSHEADAPDRIVKLIRAMKLRFDQGEREFALKESAYAALIQAYANCGNPEAAKLAQRVFDAAPEKFKNTELYNALIGAQGGDSISAEAILQEMHKAYLDGNEMVQPNTESFNLVLMAWSRSGSPMAAWRADGIFNRMNELTSRGELPVKPNGRTFDMVISTLANELGADGALKVERYLGLLKDYYRSGELDCTPSVTSYTEAIRAWGSNIEDPRSVLRAKALLDEMHELASEGVTSLRPDLHTYSVYLRGLARSTAESKADLAKDVAIMMKSDGIEPEGHLLEHLQRCLLPSTAVLSGWAVLEDRSGVDEEIVKLR